MKENHGVGRFIKSIKMSNKKGQAMISDIIIENQRLLGKHPQSPFDRMMNHAAARFFKTLWSDKYG